MLQCVYCFLLTEHLIPVLLEKKLHAAQDGFSRQQTTNQMERILSKFQRKLHALYIHALPIDRVTSTMSHAMFNSACKMFQLHMKPEKPGLSSPSSQRLGRLTITEKELIALLRALQEVGLGDSLAQRAFAHAMDKLIGDFIVSHWMKVDWERQSSVTHKLRRWINHGFSPFCRSVIACLGGTPSDPTNLTDADVPQYLHMAIARLGRARIENLFDYIVQWDVSLGAVLDIKEHITTPKARLYLTSNFSHQVARRLLHAGVTTTHILNIYISIIRAFNELDSKGVLLDRVARPIRRYLRDREDTARIIVSSLLFEAEDDIGNQIEPGSEISIEIAKEMNKPITDLDEHDYDMDWDNMSWTPDPIDAGPEYKASKTQDVTTALLSLYDKEEFTNELKTILGDHLLRNQEESHFEKEERLLELFKHRLGDDKLQACEVMLRDVQTSRSMNKLIHRYQPYQEVEDQSHGLKLNTQILSRFFWPSLRDDAFVAPAPIKALQEQYEKGFESIKDMRRLDWLPALGRVTVELEFPDRKIEEVVPTWTASVIYAFNDDDEAKSVEQLSMELEMEEPLVRNALLFWLSKQVLQETSPDTYVVIDTLPTATATGSTTTSAEAAAQAAQQAAILDAASGAAGVSAVKSQADILEGNAELYKNFILGMLTNGGNMAVARIEMMLKIVVPGGFAFGAEEVKGLLEGMEVEGKVIGQGDVWGIRKE
jgi:anaphase-promoting complex subunit 2